MTDIKIILESEPISTFTADERSIIYEQIAAENPKLSLPTVQAFAEMDEAITLDANTLERPTLRELMIKKLIDLSRGYVSPHNTLILPIVQKAAEVSFGARRKPTGGSDHHSVRIRFGYSVAAYLQTGLDYFSSPNEELQVIGLVVNDRCKPAVEHVGINPVAAADSLRSGTYNTDTLLIACDGLLATPSTPLKPGRFMFASMDKLDDFLGELLDKLQLFVAQRRANSGLLVYNQIGAALDPAAKSQIASFLTTTASGVPTEITPEGPREPILADFESSNNSKFYAAFRIAVVADIYNRGLEHIYQSAATNGRDNDEVRRGLKAYQGMRTRAAFIAAGKLRAIDEKNKLGVYKQLIGKKLGPKRLADVEHGLKLKPTLVADAKNVLTLLKPQEATIIATEYKKHDEYLDAFINNKCPHVQTYATFRRAVERNFVKTKLIQVMDFVKNKDATDAMYSCKLCKFDIMCPHIREFTELDLAGKNTSEIRAHMTKYATQGVSRGQLYCKICGELLSNLDAFDDGAIAVESLASRDEELSQFIWAEIISNVKYLRFPTVVDVRNLVSAARDACYPFIAEIEKQVVKSKTNTVDEIRAKKRLYVAVYAFAYFIHLIIHNRGKVAFRNLPPAKSAKNEVVDMIKHAIELILVSKNVIIRSISGMTPDGIKNILIDAYKSITSVGAQVIAHTGDEESVVSILLLDPVYKYFYQINTAGRGGRVPTSRFDIVDKLEEIMGGPVKSIEKREDVFVGAKRPKLDTSAFGMSFKPADAPKLPKLMKAYIDASFELFDKKIKDRVWAEYTYIGEPEEAKFRPAHAKLRTAYSEFAVGEDAVYKYRALAALQPHTRLPAAPSQQWRDRGAGLNRLFDEKGRPHAWKTFIISKDGEEVEMTAAEIARDTEAGKPIGAILDKKCDICGVRRSAVSGDDAQIKQSLRQNRDLGNFYIFYENRCPEGGLHETDGGTCTKCGFTQKIGKSKDLAFYNKFIAKYTEERDTTTLHQPSIPPQPLNLNPDPELDAWVFNFNAIMELCQRLDINYKLIMALGSYEKQDYADVKSGTYIPAEPEERMSTRAFAIDAHIKRLIMEYNRLRRLTKIPRPPPDLVELADVSGINKHKYVELTADFPDIGAGYAERYFYVRRTKKPRDIVAFCIQELCNKCAAIIDYKHGETDVFRKAFVQHILKKIVHSEEMVTNPGYFNWSLLYGEIEQKTEDSNYNPDAGDVEPEEADEEDTAAPFSSADLDIDVDPDADPEDEGNGWKVGENYGLT